MPSAASAENVRVICRCRPENHIELSRGGSKCVQFYGDRPGAIEVTVDECASTFNFDRMFDMESTQQEVFENTVFPLISDVMSGYNATVFAYGQTGTGKTHTMEGNIKVQGQEGIIPRSVEALFSAVIEADENIEFTFKVSYVEIYMEKIRDLLDPNRLKNNLTVREDKVSGVYIAGVTEEYVTSQEELYELMQGGANHRATAATGMNEGSSRSHSVFTITIYQKDLSNATSKSGKLVLVDLAGSEMVKKTSASGQQLEEAKTINKSLSALGQVINALTDKNVTHVPYRDSKLTRVLQDSLGGNSKTVLIVAISPSSYNGNETLGTLRFGMRAKSIENKVTVNATRSVEELEALLVRAEKALDAQSAHIITITGQLKEYQDGGAPPERAINAEDSDSTSQDQSLDGLEGEQGGNGKRNKGSAAQTQLIEDLQGQVAALTQELEDSNQDSMRKDGELDEMGGLLRDKERLLGEAGELLQEARRHYESQRARCELLVSEKSESSSSLDSLKANLEGEIEKMRFQMKEQDVVMDTLRAENKQYVQEIAEMSGDSAVSRGDASSTPTPIRNRRSSVGSVGGAPLPPAPGPETPLASVNWAGVPSAAERKEAQSEELGQFLALCAEQNRDSSDNMTNTAALSAYVQKVMAAQEANVIALETHVGALERASAEYAKRVRELENQRDRLEVDLKSRTESAVRLKLQLETLSLAGNGGTNSSASAELLAQQERDRTQSKSLQQRLEQLVSVHRQLLRKFASLELDSGELKKKMSLRDDRIKQLEGNAKGANAGIRTQNERHVAELTNLREQIQLLRQEHQQRVEQEKHYQEYSANEPPRSLRGGQTGQGRPQSIRGGPRSSIGGASGSPQQSTGNWQSVISRVMGGGGAGPK